MSSVYSDNLADIIHFQDYWRPTLPLRSIYLIILNNFASFLQIKFLEIFKHWDLRKSNLFKLILSRVSADPKFKLYVFWLLVHRVEVIILEIKLGAVLIVFFGFIQLIILNVVMNHLIMIFFNTKQGNVESFIWKAIILAVNKYIIWFYIQSQRIFAALFKLIWICLVLLFSENNQNILRLFNFIV